MYSYETEFQKNFSWNIGFYVSDFITVVMLA
jgi:hypothetical protein